MLADENQILFSIMLRHAQKDLQDTLRDVYDENYNGFLLVLVMLEPAKEAATKLSVTVENKKFDSFESMKTYAAAFKLNGSRTMCQKLFYHFDGKNGCKLLRDV